METLTQEDIAIQPWGDVIFAVRAERILHRMRVPKGGHRIETIDGQKREVLTSNPKLLGKLDTWNVHQPNRNFAWGQVEIIKAVKEQKQRRLFRQDATILIAGETVSLGVEVYSATQLGKRDPVEPVVKVAANPNHLSTEYENLLKIARVLDVIQCKFDYEPALPVISGLLQV